MTDDPRLTVDEARQLRHLLDRVQRGAMAGVREHANRPTAVQELRLWISSANTLKSMCDQYLKDLK